MQGRSEVAPTAGAPAGATPPSTGGRWPRRRCDRHRSAPRAGPTGARGAEGIGLRVGDDVSHDKFGEGVILELVGEGDKTEAVVHFRDVGEKRLLLAWAPLAKVGA